MNKIVRFLLNNDLRQYWLDECLQSAGRQALKYDITDRIQQQIKNCTCSTSGNTLFFFYKNVVFPAQAEYSYFCADFRLKIFLYYS